jgi:hypothetical protein
MKEPLKIIIMKPVRTLKIFTIFLKKIRAGGIAQWLSTCPACTMPCVPSLAIKKKKRNVQKQDKELYIFKIYKFLKICKPVCGGIRKEYVRNVADW